MESSSNSRVLPYTLCSITAAGIMFNIIHLIWHCVKFKSGREGRYIKYAYGALSIAYIFIGFAITMLILYSDIGSEDLCKIGGFLSLFASQECLWMLATSSLVYLLWIKSKIAKSHYTKTDYEVSNKWSVPIFILIIIVKCIILAIVSFLPMTNIAYFSIAGDSYYLCTPMRVPGEQGWPYSTLILILSWIALIIAIVNTTFIYCKHKQISRYIISDRSSHKHSEDIQVELTMKVSLGYNSSFWSLVLLLFSINYFSSGGAISQDNIHWTVGFLVSVLVGFHPVLILLIQRVMKSSWFRTYYCREKLNLPEPPGQLCSIQSSHPQNKDIGRYMVHWKNTKGHLVAGVMKVFHPSLQSKWRAEVHTVAKLTETGDSHNIAKYQWASPCNKYTELLSQSTGDFLSSQCSLVCMVQYGHGNLQQFLKTRIHQITEVGIHKLSLDVANGLDFIHSNGIVHNMLNSKCVYMASVSEQIGLRAVIGDFEHSTEVTVTPDELKQRQQLYAISYEHSYEKSTQSGVFMPDIRAFGILVLEMLVSLSEFNYDQMNKTKKNRISHHEEKHGFQMIPHSSVVGYGQKTHKKSARHQHCENNNCTCSSKVTDIRAHSRQSDHHSGISTAESVGSRQNYRKAETMKDSEYWQQTKADITNHVYENPKVPAAKIKQLQQRELPPIPFQIEKVVAEVVNSAVSTDSVSDVQCESKFTPDKPAIIKPKLKPKPNLIKSIQEAVFENQESDVDSLYVRSTTSTIQTGPDPQHQKAEASLKVAGSMPRTKDTSNEDMYNMSVNSCTSFETIYEDDESQDSMAHSLDSGLGKSKIINHMHHVKRKQGLYKQNGDVPKKPHLSSSSFNESVLSADSGLASSHYSYGSGPQASAGSRGTIYETDASETQSDSYSLLMAYLERNRQKMGEHVVPAHNTVIDNVNEVDFDEVYEILPDLKIRKKPCTGSHSHVPGHPCCSVKTNVKKPTDNNNVNSDKLENVDLDKVLVDEATMTTNTLDHTKHDKYPQNTDSESALTDLSFTSVGRNIDHKTNSYIGKPPVTQRVTRAVPRLGLTAVAFSRQMASPTGLTAPSGSMQSLTTGRSSVMSGRSTGAQSSRSLPANSINSSVMSLLQDSNLFVENKHHRSHTNRTGHFVSSSQSSFASGSTVRRGPVSSKVVSNHPVVRHIMSTQPAHFERVLDMLRKNGCLGYTATQLVPLLKECWLQETVPSTQDILYKLDQVLPTATV